MPTAEEMLSAAAVRELARIFRRVAPGPELARLTRAAGQLGDKSFSERGKFVRDAVLAGVPGEFAELDRVVRLSLAEPGFSGWMIWPVTEAVAARAVEAGRARVFDAGLALLAELTTRLTGEFAIRTFLAADPERVLRAAQRWTGHPDEQVRRLASEGTRPRLPWARQVPAILAEPRVTMPILDALYRDESEYVRRSVANHLNDISRADPALCVETATRWLAQPDENTARLVRHGLRTLIKKGDPGALALLGFAPPVSLAIDGPRLDVSELAVGGELTFEFTVANEHSGEARLAIDYVVHHVKANGTRTPKVFKLTTRTLAPGETATIAKRHSFKPISTRVYHPGEHALELQINGRPYGHIPFQLTT